MRKLGFIMWACAMAALTGCGAVEDQVVIVARPSYEKISYQTTKVLRGDLSVDVTLRVTTEGYEEIMYRAPESSFTLEGMHVAVGDQVKKGEILVSFVSEELKQKIADYEDGIQQKELLIEHYTKLMEVDGNADYELDVEMLRQDIGIARLYIEETQSLLAEYQIVAKADGIVTKVSEYLQNGVVTPGVELITQMTGTGNYLATTSEPDFFAVGDCYPVKNDDIEYELYLAEINGESLIFRSTSGQTILSPDETYELKLERPMQKDVVYVNRHGVCTLRGEEEVHYVYVMEENGYQRAVFVTPEERIGENIIITEGLQGGEKVVIR